MNHAGTVCITGATSGIGRAYAIALAGRGYRLILTGRRKERLESLAHEVTPTIVNASGAFGTGPESSTAEVPPVEVVIGDLRDPAACRNLSQKLSDRQDLVMLIHNAGYGLPGGFFQSSPDALRGMGEVHMQCAVELVAAAHTRLTSSPVERSLRGHLPRAIILVSSVAAFLPAPGPAMYTATKRFLVELARALQPALSRDKVRIQALCPGFTRTEFHDRLNWSQEARRNRGIIRWMTAEEVVERSLKDLARRGYWSNPVFVPGFYNRLIITIVRLIPPQIYRRLMRRQRNGPAPYEGE